MFVINEDVEIEIIEKKSRFITRLYTLSSEEKALEIVNELRKSEKGAAHNCFAYRILKEERVFERKSDDGEPGGTAGAPMLAVLTGNRVINVLAVTTRYFGGIKLGTGGLVNVYKKGVKNALNETGLVEYIVLKRWSIKAHISKTDHLDYLLKQVDIEVSDKNYSQNVEFIVETAEDNYEILTNICDKVSGVIAAAD